MINVIINTSAAIIVTVVFFGFVYASSYTIVKGGIYTFKKIKKEIKNETK